MSATVVVVTTAVLFLVLTAARIMAGFLQGLVNALQGVVGFLVAAGVTVMVIMVISVMVGIVYVFDLLQHAQLGTN